MLLRTPQLEKSADPEGSQACEVLSAPPVILPTGPPELPITGGSPPLCREPWQAPKRDSKTHISGMVTLPASLEGFGSPNGLQKGHHLKSF